MPLHVPGLHVEVGEALPSDVARVREMTLSFENCPVCHSGDQVRMPDAWRAKVDAGEAIPIVGCGNPWHYSTDSMADPRVPLTQAQLDEMHSTVVGALADGMVDGPFEEVELPESLDMEALRQAVWHVKAVENDPAGAAQVIAEQATMIATSTAVIRALVRRLGGKVTLTREQIVRGGPIETVPDGEGGGTFTTLG